MGQSSSLEESLREGIESLIDSAPDTVPSTEDAPIPKDASKGDEKARESPEDNDKKDVEKKLSNKLLFNDNYTELKITNGKQYLKWKTVTLSQNGTKASLGRYQIRIDKIFGLSAPRDGFFTIHALGTRDDSVPNVESLLDRVKFKGLTMARKAYSMMPFTSKQWYQNEYVFEAQDPEQATQWLDLLCELTGLDWAERDMMILVNPETDRDSLKVLDAVLPMFEAANVCVHIKRTKNIQETAHNTTLLTEYKHLIVVGGDKTLHEAINGLLSRPDWDYVLKKCAIAAIPCGAGNTLSKNLGTSHSYLAALTAIRGTPYPMDIMSVTNPTGFRLFSYMNFSWGLLADMGMSKTPADFGFNFATINRLLSPNVYNGTLHYLVPSKRLEFTAEESVRMAQPNSEAERLAKPGPIDHFTTIDTKFLPKHWETVKAAFSMLLVANMPWVNKKLVANPLATANDGAVDLIYTQSGLLGFLTWLFFPSKAYHMNLPNWNFKRARAFILEPGKDLDGKDGNFLVDGQKIPYSSIRCEVHPGLIKVITPQRKIQSQEAKVTANKEKWNLLAKRSSWSMVSLDTYQQHMTFYWVGAFSLLAVCFAYAAQL